MPNELFSFLVFAVGAPSIATAALAIFYWKRLKRYLRFLQQEEYNNARFIAWIASNRAYDTRGSTIALAASALSYFFSQAVLLHLFVSFGAASMIIYFVLREEEPTTAGKIKLNLTERARRILHTASALAVITWLVLIFSAGALLDNSYELWASGWLSWVLVAAFCQATPLWLVAAVAMLQPGENARQLAFLNEAKTKFRNAGLTVVGITGSYGKTSTKAVLGKLLEVSLGPTFWPERSINTPMGITREIREKLKPGHKYAVMEMGAYRKGSIKSICELTPPGAAIVTAVGIMHLERFGSPENVYLAKSELPQAVPTDGILVCNGDDPGARRMAGEYPKKTTLLYGLHPERGPLDCRMSELKLEAAGTHFQIHWRDKSYSCFARLHGTPILSNVLAAFTMAAALGADPEYIIGAIRNLLPVDNRLEVKIIGPVVHIRDAYNSNPVGFAAALDVLKSLPTEFPNARRILLTPGMIELGDKQAEENEKIGQYAAGICDLVMLVGHANRESIFSGLAKAGFDKSNIRLYENRDSALAALTAEQQNGDIVLIENDLPDLYEVDARF